VFSLDTFADRTFVMASLASAAAIILGTELRFFQRILDTVELTGNQWLICIGAGLTVVAASEMWKFALRRREAPAEPAAAEQPEDDPDMVAVPA
jgi:Ca2+-transporting ATPase